MQPNVNFYRKILDLPHPAPKYLSGDSVCCSSEASLPECTFPLADSFIWARELSSLRNLIIQSQHFYSITEI